MASTGRTTKLWSPSNPSSTNLDTLRRHVNKKRQLCLKDSTEFQAWTVNPQTSADWWMDLFEFEKMQPGVIPKCSINQAVSRMFPPPQFFPDIRMNFAEHILANRKHKDVALYACTEGALDLRSYTWGELWKSVEQIADALVAAGIREGDRVAAVISNCPEAVVSCLAVLSIGALWSTSSPDMGTKGIMDRLIQIQPKIVLFESSVLYNGKVRDLLPKCIDCIHQLEAIPNFQFAVVIERQCLSSVQYSSTTRSWDKFRSSGTNKKLTFTRLPFNHPGFIVYSSGTTGAPKCIVHSACGLLMQIKKDYMLSLDVREGDSIFQYTTTGWIMWAMVLCGLSYGGKVLLYDGSPFLPDPLVTIRLVEKLKFTLYGTSARFLSDLKSLGINPREHVDLSSLRTVTSTGSVLNADVCKWFYESAFPPSVHLASISGGTDMACSLVIGDSTKPMYAGEIQAPALGMAVDVFDPSASTGYSVRSSGQPGELVCTQPFPSQPIQFWGDTASNTRYRNSYFERFGESVWVQGDFVAVNPATGGYIMLGRSDGVLNPSGVRFGSAEIYNAIQNHSPAYPFADTICVGQRRPQDADETVLLFVKMQPGSTRQFGPELVASLQDTICKALSPRHVPKFIFEVPDVPYTINGKKIEIAVKQIVCGLNIVPSGAVANPESLEYFKRFFNLEEAARQSKSSVKSAKL